MSLFQINKKECLHCGKDSANYCEKCFQDLISKNMQLQLENEKMQEEIMENDLKVIGAEEYTEASMREIIENYYTANEDCIPKQVLRDKIEELETNLKEFNLSEYCLYEDSIQEKIKIYKELLIE